MFTVTWKTADDQSGSVVLVGDDKWSFGRAGGAETPTVVSDNPLVSRTALVIRDSGPGPVVFRGQRDNGAHVTLINVDGHTTWLDEGTAGNLSPLEHRVEFTMRGELLISIDVIFDDRGSVVERRGDAPVVEAPAPDTVGVDTEA